jgi:hypothetical protein
MTLRLKLKYCGPGCESEKETGTSISQTNHCVHPSHNLNKLLPYPTRSQNNSRHPSCLPPNVCFTDCISHDLPTSPPASSTATSVRALSMSTTQHSQASHPTRISSELSQSSYGPWHLPWASSTSASFSAPIIIENVGPSPSTRSLQDSPIPLREIQMSWAQWRWAATRRENWSRLRRI